MRERLNWLRSVVGALAVLMAGRVWGQEKPEEVRIVVPVVDKGAGTVVLPGAFWNEHVAEWVEVGLSGRPSDFLHETLVCTTTTRALLEGALREAGCRDGDAWVDGVKDFVRVRGDRFIVLVSLERAGKKEVYSLDELLCFSRWGVALGPYGFMFKGDPDHGGGTAGTVGGATLPGLGEGSDGMKIMRDDPQMALVFKGLQNRTQSFADHPLAYVEDRWEWEEIDRGRNHAVLGAEVFDSNGKVPLTLTFKRVTEEQLLAESGKVWHDEGFKAYMLKQVETAKRIDTHKAEYLALRQMPESREANEARLRLLAAEIESDYAILDGAWSRWAVDHVKPESADENGANAIRSQAKRWGEFMALNQQRAAQRALAAEAGEELRKLGGAGDAATLKQREILQGKVAEASSRALIAENQQSRDYWQGQWSQINDPKANDVWAISVSLHLAQEEARLKAGEAGAAYGQARQAAEVDAGKLAALQAAAESAVREMSLAETRLSLASVEFEISKRTDMPMDPELAGLRKEREELQARVKELGG